MSSNFWKNKKVLVTGAGGFLGTALSSRLKREGAMVISVSKIARGDIVAGDITSKRQMEVFLSSRDLYACFHLAGEALVEKGKQSPYTTFKNNIVGTLNILELGKIYNIPRIIISSTAHVYGDTKPPTSEDTPAKPSRPYETSKTCADLIAQSYADSYHLPVLIPRFVNIYGPGDMNFSRLIPKTIRSILAGQSPMLWGGEAKRDFLYIDDAIEAFVRLAETPNSTLETNRIFNFASGEVTSIRSVIEKLIALSGADVAIQHEIIGREQEISSQFVTLDKAHRILGWQANTMLPEGLKKTLTWYRDHPNLRSAAMMPKA